MADLMGKEPEEISLVFKGKMLDTSKVSRLARRERCRDTQTHTIQRTRPVPIHKDL
jgi:hypothetical protein